MKNEKGFSLVELLVVVIIIAIIAAIAIPSLLASRRAANEASAISSLRTINSAQATYYATNGNNTAYATALGPVGTAGTLSNLGPIDPALGASATPTKSGYDFLMSTNGAGAGNTIYCAAATADVQDSTGVRSFAVSNPGVVYSWPDETHGCASGAITGGTAIQ